MKPTLKDAKRIAKKLKTTIDPKRLLVGMKIEMEHGNISKETSVTDDDLETTAKIALAHFQENPGNDDFGDYYSHLEKQEKMEDKYWASHHKKPIFLSQLSARDVAEIVDQCNKIESMNVRN